ncbi:hypothetical protein CHS0354_021537 [Potamilus streckersoni]|uniref:Uncharacterized protein n=1 Tax=Potamilus streckersoni TaxID=2493646 RepID=A0AAE0SNA6_9BIVA|nr:hypothetical protein CHS0354_021537 [Potamilus streckersoni]
MKDEMRMKVVTTHSSVLRNGPLKIWNTVDVNKASRGRDQGPIISLTTNYRKVCRKDDSQQCFEYICTTLTEFWS